MIFNIYICIYIYIRVRPVRSGSGALVRVGSAAMAINTNVLVRSVHSPENYSLLFVAVAGSDKHI